MRKVCAKLVPKVLTDEQKENRVSISRELLDRVRGDPNFFEQVITGDETWVFEYDPETKRQSSEWHTTRVPLTKEGSNEQIKDEIDAHCFFFLL